jgi:hypothetical protein
VVVECVLGKLCILLVVDIGTRNLLMTRLPLEVVFSVSSIPLPCYGTCTASLTKFSIVFWGTIFWGTLTGLFQVLLHWLLQKPCQTPNQKNGSQAEAMEKPFCNLYYGGEAKTSGFPRLLPHV